MIRPPVRAAEQVLERYGRCDRVCALCSRVRPGHPPGSGRQDVEARASGVNVEAHRCGWPRNLRPEWRSAVSAAIVFITSDTLLGNRRLRVLLPYIASKGRPSIGVMR